MMRAILVVLVTFGSLVQGATSIPFHSCSQDIIGCNGTDSNVTLSKVFESTANGVRGEASERNTDDAARTCSIWMAPSSLIGHTGFGVYTTRDIDEDESILAAPDGPAIPVVEPGKGLLEKERQRWNKDFDDYWWGDTPDHTNYEAQGNILELQITLGSLLNHNCLPTVDHRYPEKGYDDSLADRFQDPGAGAFSYSMGRDFYVDEDVKAGDELFLSYGHCTRDPQTLEDWSWTANIPMTEDYEKAGHIAWWYYELYNDSDIEIVPPKHANEFVAALLPKSTSHLREIIASSNDEIESQDDLVTLLGRHMTTTPRTPEWIRSHGMCIENLIPRKSNLSGAGQGGFAQYFIGKGEMVVPAPLLHIPNKNVLLMHDENDGSQPRWQLLLNYCFGHNESSLLLCPNTNAILINHCSHRKKQCGPNGPNAEYRWSSGWEPKSDEFRNMTVEEIANQPGRGLSMEIVALRDIHPGEEVYVDYGPQWEKAWEEHVADWKPPVEDSEMFISAKEANEQEQLKLLVTEDIQKASNHSYLFTGCRYQPPKRESRRRLWYHDHDEWWDLDDDEILDAFAGDGSIYDGDYPEHTDNDYWPCTVVSQDDTDTTYIVRIHQHRYMPQQVWDKHNLPRLLTDYPRQSIRYFVKPGASDQHLPNAFRHPIGIRDEMFPEQWKNRI